MKFQDERTEYIFPNRPAAEQFREALRREGRSRRIHIAPALPLYRHGSSPGVSVHFTACLGALIELQPALRECGGKARKSLLQERGLA